MAPWPYPRVIAHRCGGTLAPENTLAGLRIAARLGCRAVEFDVMLSRDGVPVLIHDDTLERTTDGQGRVADTDLSAIRRLDAGVRHAPSFSGEPLPTLVEAIACCNELGLLANIEIKPSLGLDLATGAAVAALTKKLWRDHRPPLLSSFSEDALAAAVLAAPQLPRALLVDAIPDDWVERLRRLGAIAIHCCATQFEPGQAATFTATLAAAGVPLACYTVNNPALAETLFAAGIAAVFTDRPDLFAAASM
jgi:glycerophosphoryl diester phosphodiesterase